MGSTTSFLGFFYPNLLLVFSEPVIFRNLYHFVICSRILDINSAVNIPQTQGTMDVWR